MPTGSVSSGAQRAKVGEALCDRRSGRVDVDHRALSIFGLFQKPERRFKNLRSLLPGPAELAAHEFRVKGADKNGDAPKGQSAGGEPFAQARQDVVGPLGASRAVDQLGDDAIDFAWIHAPDLPGDATSPATFVLNSGDSAS